MLILSFVRGTVGDRLDDEAIDRVAAALPDRYQRILKPTLRFEAQLLSISESALALGDSRPRPPSLYRQPGSYTRGELFTDGVNLFALAIRDPEPAPKSDLFTLEDDGTATGGDQTLIQVFMMSSTADRGPMSEFAKAVTEALGIALEPSAYSNARFKDLRSEGRSTAERAPADLPAARVLSDKSVRAVALAIKASGGLLVTDLGRPLPVEEKARITEIQQALKDASLVSGELFVVCRKTGARSLRAPSREVLDDASVRGVKCPCGNRISDERVEEALAISELGRGLLDGSRWLSVLVVEQLTDLGIRPEDILLDQQIGGDEMDVLADISGELAFFELKDKEFNLGNAYSFGAKIGIIRPNHSVVVTTDKVGNDARDHFQRVEGAATRRGSYASGLYVEDEQRHGVRYIEGLSNLERGLRELVTEIYSADSARIVGELLDMAKPSAAAVVAALAGRSGGTQPAVEPESPREEESTRA